MSENSVPDVEQQSPVATLPAISRRLGITSKQLKQFTVRVGVKSSSLSSAEELYFIDEIVAMLESLEKSEQNRFRSLQKPQKMSYSMYKDKFSSLKKWAPPLREERKRQSSKKKREIAPSWNPTKVDSRDGKVVIPKLTPEELARMSGFDSPLTAKQVSLALNVPLRFAAEAIYGSGYPTTQLKNILVVDLRRDQLGSFIADLPDGLREKMLIAQKNKNSQIPKAKLAEILKLSQEDVMELLKQLPGSPTSLSLEALEYARSLEEFQAALKTADRKFKDSDDKSKGKRQRRKQNKNVTLEEIAEHFNITEENAMLLAKRKFFPRHNPVDGTVHIASRQIPEPLMYEMLDENCYTLSSMSKDLRIAAHRLEVALSKDKIVPVNRFLLKHSTMKHKIVLYSERDVERFKRSDSYQKLLKEEAEQKALDRADRKKSAIKKTDKEEADFAEYMLEIADRVVVDTRERLSPPKKATFYVGPTNSGKTYHSLKELFEEYERNSGRGLYVYAGPLRMLAYEVYEKMVYRFGEDAVGFLTGEEQINPEANLLACTVEMAPDEGTSLVLDEAHWIVDSDRGQHWTHLLMGGRYTNMHILTAKEALAPLKELVSDSDSVTTREFQRKTPIFYSGELSLKQIPPRTAVVAFSRRTVYAIAGELARAGKKVGVLYGALPLKVRKSQIEKYVDGTYDIMVTTDVIGHGINLPIDNVVFAQTEKFDGRERREIYVWEAAQIAGRAGRYGLSEGGNVYGLEGKPWFSKNTGLMREGTLAAGGLTETDLIAEQALLFPRYGDLKLENSSEVPQAVVSWRDKASRIIEERPVTPSDLSVEYKLFERVAEIATIPQFGPERGWDGLPPNIVWQLMSGPFNPKGNVISVTTKWLMEPNSERSRTLEKYFDRLVIPVNETMKAGKGLLKDQVSLFESISSEIGELKMVDVMFDGAGTLRLSELKEYEDIIDGFLIRSLSAAVRKSKYGKCEKCNRNCSPWFSLCDRCSFEKSWW